MALELICRILRTKGEMQQALEVARTIPNEFRRGEALYGICLSLHAIDIDKAIAVAQEIPNKYTRKFALNAICETLKAAGKMAQAAAVTELIPKDANAGCVIA